MISCNFFFILFCILNRFSNLYLGILRGSHSYASAKKMNDWNEPNCLKEHK